MTKLIIKTEKDISGDLKVTEIKMDEQTLHRIMHLLSVFTEIECTQHNNKELLPDDIDFYVCNPWCSDDAEERWVETEF